MCEHVKEHVGFFFGGVSISFCFLSFVLLEQMRLSSVPKQIHNVNFIPHSLRVENYAVSLRVVRY